MKGEMSFLLKLFMEDDHKKMRILITERIAELENACDTPVVQTSGYMTPYIQTAAPNQFVPQTNNPVVAMQSPSTQRIMQQNPDLVPQVAAPTTPAAAAALQARQHLLSQVGNEKPLEGRRSPKKV